MDPYLKWIEDITTPDRILLVEDDQLWAEVLLKVAKEFNCVTSHVTNGADAVKMIKGGKWTVIILDVVMPLLDGVEVLKEIYRSTVNVDDVPPVVMVSAFFNHEIINKAAAFGLVAFVMKQATTPQNMRRLLKTLGVRPCPNSGTSNSDSPFLP